MRFARVVSTTIIMVVGSTATFAPVRPVEAQVQAFPFVSLNVTRTVKTMDPDIVMSVNWKGEGTTRSLGGWNNKNGLKIVTADYGRLELIPIPVAKAPVQFIEGGYSFNNQGDPMKWSRMYLVGQNLGVKIPLDEGENGDRFMAMWVRLKNGKRTEFHWLFGGTAKKSDLNASDLFSHHILSVRDGEGNLLYPYRHRDGRVNHRALVRVALRYGSGLVPGFVLDEEEDVDDRDDPPMAVKPDGSQPKQEEVDVTSAGMVFTSPSLRYIYVQWLNADGSDGPQDEVTLEPGKSVFVKARAQYKSFDLYDRPSPSDDWLRVKSNGQNISFPTPVGRRQMSF